MKGFVRALSYVGAIIAVASLAACSDPTSASLGAPSYIDPSFSVLNQKAGSHFTLSASLRDAQRNSLGNTVTATYSSALLTEDSVPKFIPELNQTNFYLHAGNTTKVDSATVTLTAAGISKVVKVIVAP